MRYLLVVFFLFVLCASAQYYPPQGSGTGGGSPAGNAGDVQIKGASTFAAGPMNCVGANCQIGATVVPAGAVDARSSGALSSQADVTTALNLAIAAANTAHAPLYLPAGTWKVSSCITLPQYGLIGDGPLATILQAVTASAPACVGVAANTHSYVRGVAFDGHATATVALELYNSGGSSFDAVKATGAVSDGIRLDLSYTTPTGTNDGTILTNPIAQSNGRDGISIPAHQSDNNGIQITNCYCSNNTRNGLMWKGDVGVITGGIFEGNAINISIGEDGDGASTSSNVFVQPIVDLPVTTAGYSAQHAVSNIIFLNQSAVSSWTGHVSSSDILVYDNAGVMSYTGTGQVPATLAAQGVNWRIAAYNAGDLACAEAGDTTINPLTISAITDAAPPVATVTTSPITAGYYIGLPVTVVGVTNGAFNKAYTVGALDSTHVTLSGTAPGGGASSAGTTSMTCGNASVDAITTGTYYSFGAITIPKYALTSGTMLEARGQYRFYAPATNNVTAMKLNFNSNTLYTNSGGAIINGVSGNGGAFDFSISGLSASFVGTQLVASSMPTSSGISTFANPKNFGVQNEAIGNSATLGLLWGFTASGVASGTYTSGITTTGTIGQTCALTSFNNSSTATATVALTGTNTIAGGTSLVITGRGIGASTAPTTATAGNGTATCSGTATIATVLGGAPGYAVQQIAFGVK